MPLKTAAEWGQETADAIAAVGVEAGTEVTPAQLALVWEKIKEVSIASLGQADVAAGTFVDGMAAPVAGIGGPVT